MAPALEVGHAQRHANWRQTGRVEPPLRRSIDRIDGDDRHLACSVGRKPAHARPFGYPSRHSLAHRRRPPHDVAQRGQVELLEIGVVGHRQRDRCHRHLQGHFVRLNEMEHIVQIEATMQSHRGTCAGGSEQIKEPEDVRGRRGDLEAIGRARGRASDTSAQCHAPSNDAYGEPPSAARWCPS